MQNALTKFVTDGSDTIAVVGLSCRLPGGISSGAELWQALTGKKCLISKVPADRFSTKRFEHPRREVKGHSVTFRAGVLEDVSLFDPAFFGMGKLEAQTLDPQQRLALELSWEAIENAGIKPSALKGSDTAVFIGAASTDMALSRADDALAVGPYTMTGTNLSIISNRLSYFYDLHGPSMTVDTACSSSLSALHQACVTLRSKRSRAAIAGGVNILLSPLPFIGFSQAHMLSPAGLCKVFAADADGYVRAEGGAVVLLKRLTDAVADGDPILALIERCEINQDGRTNGIALPSVSAQSALLQSIYGGHDLSSLVYLEAHGTGTAAGDPIECEAAGVVAKALYAQTGRTLKVGSVKSNVGHLETASGMAGLSKAVQMLLRQQIPPQLYADNLNPGIAFSDLRLQVPGSLEIFPKTPEPALIGLNSFGFGGSNGHLLLRRYEPDYVRDCLREQGVMLPGVAVSTVQPAQQNNLQTTPVKQSESAAENLQPLYFLLSAKSENALRRLCSSYANILNKCVNKRQAEEICTAAALKRELFAERLFIKAVDLQHLCQALQNYAAGQTSGTNVKLDGSCSTEICREQAASNGKLALVCSGNGSQYPGMGYALYRELPGFARYFDEAAAELAKLQNIDFKTLIKTDPKYLSSDKQAVAVGVITDNADPYAAVTSVLKSQGTEPATARQKQALPEQGKEQASPVGHTVFCDYDSPLIAQPFIFAIEYALGKMLAERGVKPDACCGHSVGEVAAACLSGALSLKQAALVIVQRSRLQAKTSRIGGMAAVKLASDKLERILREGTSRWPGVEVAAHNAPDSYTISGPKSELKEISAAIKRERGAFKLLKLDYAFHSSMMDPIKEELVSSLSGLTGLADPAADQGTVANDISFYSALDGKQIKAEQLDGEYWWHNIRCRVNFAATVENLLRAGFTKFIEVGPRSILCSYIKQTAASADGAAAAVSLLPAAAMPDTEGTYCAYSLLRLTASGFTSDLSPYFTNCSAETAALLPHYPFERERCWPEHSSESFNYFNPEPAGALLGFKLPFDSSFINELDIDKQPFLSGHQVGSEVLMPFAAFLIAAKSAVECDDEGRRTMRVINFELNAPLPLTNGLRRLLVKKDGQRKLSFASRALGDKSFVTVATARYLPCEVQQGTAIDLKALQAALDCRNTDDVYTQAEAAGICYHGEFCRLRSVFSGTAEALALIDFTTEDDDLPLSVAGLDGALQLLFLLKGDTGAYAANTAAGSGITRQLADELYLPSAAEEFYFNVPEGSKPTQYYAHFKLRSATGAAFVCDINFYTTDGKYAGLIKGCRYRKVPRQDSDRAFYYAQEFQPLPPLPALSEPEHSAAITKAVLGSLQQWAVTVTTDGSAEQSEASALFNAALCALFGDYLRQWLGQNHNGIMLAATEKTAGGSDSGALKLQTERFYEPEQIFDCLIDEKALPLALLILDHCCAFGLARVDEFGAYQLNSEALLALDFEKLVSSLITSSPQNCAQAEFLICLQQNLRTVLENGCLKAQAQIQLAYLSERCEIFSDEAFSLRDALADAVTAAVRSVPPYRALAVLEVCADALPVITPAALPQSVCHNLILYRLALTDEIKHALEGQSTELSVSGMMPVRILSLTDLSCLYKQGSLGLDLVLLPDSGNLPGRVAENCAQAESLVRKLVQEGGTLIRSGSRERHILSRLIKALQELNFDNSQASDLDTDAGIADLNADTAAASPALSAEDDSAFCFRQEVCLNLSGFSGTVALEIKEAVAKRQGDVLKEATSSRSAHSDKFFTAANCALIRRPVVYLRPGEDGSCQPKQYLVSTIRQAKGTGGGNANALDLELVEADAALPQADELEQENTSTVTADPEKALYVIDWRNVTRSCAPVCEAASADFAATSDLQKISVTPLLSERLYELKQTLLLAKEQGCRQLVVLSGDAGSGKSAGQAENDQDLAEVLPVSESAGSAATTALNLDPAEQEQIATAAGCALLRCAVNELGLSGVKFIVLKPGVRADMLAAEIVTAADGYQEICLSSRGRFASVCTYARDGAELAATGSGYVSTGSVSVQKPIVNRTEANRYNRILGFDRAGRLSSLRLQDKALPVVAADEILIKVKATALNFRDVLWAAGLLPDEALESGFAGASLGLECSGTVVQTGSAVSSLHSGDAVMAFGSSCFGDYVITKATAALKKPAALSFAEAASLPVVFFTAYYALCFKAQAVRGESVLIHGAAGGVGLAALQIAKQLGLKVYATAGSTLKRRLLKMLGADETFSSRSLSFADEIREITQGQGVDIVLNSLYDEGAALSLSLLKPCGRFIELGKRDFYADHALYLKAFKDNLTYCGVDADELLNIKPDLCARAMEALSGAFRAGTYRPGALNLYPQSLLPRAFTDLRSSLGIGKLVVLKPEQPAFTAVQTDSSAKDAAGLADKIELSRNIDEPDAPAEIAGITVCQPGSQSSCPEDQSGKSSHTIAAVAEQRNGNLTDCVLITGGLGGLGQALIRSFAASGTSCIIACGRRSEKSVAGILSALRAELAALKRDCSLYYISADVSDEKALRDGLSALSLKSPLDLCCHAAGFLHDGRLQDLDCDSFKSLLAVKLDGALSTLNSCLWHNAHLRTRGITSRRSLRTVFFSSVSALLGNPGQGNYAAANAALEGLCTVLNVRGLPALAIGWGPVADTGMLAGRGLTAKALERRLGTAALSAREVCAALRFCLKHSLCGNFSYFKANWQHNSELVFAQSRFCRIATGFAVTREKAQSGELAAMIRNLKGKAQEQALFDLIVKEVSVLSGAQAGGLNAATELANLGMDSLTLMELTVRLSDLLHLKLSPEIFASCRTLGAFTSTLARALNVEDESELMLAAMQEQHGVILNAALQQKSTELLGDHHD